MLAKFDIEYIVRPQHNKLVDVHRTDAPIPAEDLLSGLPANGAAITAIKHEGVVLTQHQSDQTVKVAAERLISGRCIP